MLLNLFTHSLPPSKQNQTTCTDFYHSDGASFKLNLVENINACYKIVDLCMLDVNFTIGIIK